MKKCNRRRGRFCKGGNKSDFEHDCREHVTTEGREISGCERGDSWSGLGIKHKEKMRLQRWSLGVRH